MKMKWLIFILAILMLSSLACERSLVPHEPATPAAGSYEAALVDIEYDGENNMTFYMYEFVDSECTLHRRTDWHKGPPLGKSNKSKIYDFGGEEVQEE